MMLVFVDVSLTLSKNDVKSLVFSLFFTILFFIVFLIIDCGSCEIRGLCVELERNWVIVRTLFLLDMPL